MSESYNGWTNYESWLVALWLDNDQGSQEAAREIAQTATSDTAAGEAIRYWMEDTFDFPTTEMVADLVNAALARVDWHEIGAHFMADQ